MNKKLNIKHGIIAFLIVTISVQCVEEFDPGISEDANLVAVDGSLIKGRDKQKIVISRTAPLSDPEFDPITNCNVKIVDDAGNEFPFSEESQGIYTAQIVNDQLLYTHKYQLVFTTPDGNSYASSWETLVESAPVDSVYYEVESQISDQSGNSSKGVQFYVDLLAPNEGSRYYRWELEETYEYTSDFYIGGYFNGDTAILYENRQDSVYRCWTTNRVKELFSENTINLVVNQKKQIPLNFIAAGSEKIGIRYSLLVKQYALNEDAFNYWNQRKVEAKESGGLYAQQPSQASSNIENVADPNERILGYFWTSSLSKKRQFVNESFSYDRFSCESDTLVEEEYQNGPFPVYLQAGNQLLLLTAQQSCFDCTLQGGTNQKPEFW